MPIPKIFAKPYVIVIWHMQSTITVYLFDLIIKPYDFHFYGM